MLSLSLKDVSWQQGNMVMPHRESGAARSCKMIGWSPMVKIKRWGLGTRGWRLLLLHSAFAAIHSLLQPVTVVDCVLHGAHCLGKRPAVREEEESSPRRTLAHLVFAIITRWAVQP